MAEENNQAGDKASLVQRATAQILDNLILSGVALPAFVVAIFIAAGFTAVSKPVGDAVWIICLLFIGLSSFIYQTVLEYYWKGQTIGKRALDMRVVKEKGVPLEMRDAVIRNIPAILFIVPYTGIILYPLAAVTVALSDEGQRLFDVAADTVVQVE